MDKMIIFATQIYIFYNIMKTIFKIAIGAIVIFFGLALFLDDDTVDELDNTVSDEGTYDDSDEDAEADAGDIYGNAVDDDDKTAVVSSWGDGTCRAISTKEFYKLVASKSNHEEFIGEGPVVVDFWASWCGYCKQIDPHLKALAKKYKGKVQFYKVNADENEDITEAYGIQSLPTLFFCSGSDIRIEEGARSKDELDKLVQDLL